MADNPDVLQGLVQDIANAYVDGYRGQKARALTILDDMESPEGRRKLSETAPELGHALESDTREERAQRVDELSVAIGVSHAILYAFKRLQPSPQLL